MYQHTMKHTGALLFAALTLALTFCGPASAQMSSGSTNGTICEISDIEQFNGSDQVKYTSFGEILNDDPNRGLSIVCSLPRDHVGTSGTVVYAIVYKSLPNDYTACTLTTRGGVFQNQIAGPGTGEHLLVFQGLKSYGHQDLRLSCLFPKKMPGEKSGLGSVLYINVNS